MKIFILTDLEGAAGVTRWFQADPGANKEAYLRACHWLTGEVNAAVAGILEVEPKAEVVVWDGHGAGGILLEELHVQAKLIPRGFIRSPYTLDEGYEAMLMVAQHAKAGTPRATLCHTYSSQSVYRYWLNGQEVGEIGLRAYVAGALGVPVIFVSGDQAACEEAQSLIPGVETVAVKKGLHQELAITLTPKKACELIQSAAAKALNQKEKVKPVFPPPPYTFRAQFLHTNVTEEFCALYRQLARVDAFTVETKGENLIEVTRPFA
ncbi:MAG: M55 family metallopeptidase [Candidatus Omnitrophica bacterium]|nr:M55 family metallopeptidase [Candidatus Omnitrophota bacterium]